MCPAEGTPVAPLGPTMRGPRANNPTPYPSQAHSGVCRAEGAPVVGRASRANVELPCDAFTWLKYGEKSLVQPRRTRCVPTRTVPPRPVPSRPQAHATHGSW